MTEQIVFRRLSSDDDYQKIAHLIYSTDPYLYPDLFGSEEAATGVLTFLLNKAGTVFSAENYYVAEIDDEIVGLAALYKNNPVWDEEDVKNAFYEAGFRPPQSFYAVSQYFIATFNHAKLGINACNIIVDENHRGKGIATQVVRKLKALSGRAPIELNVIADNRLASSLYKSNGFVIVDTFMDYGGFEKPLIKCHKMMYCNDYP